MAARELIRRRLMLLGALLAAGLAAAGCGGQQSASSQIRATLRAASEGLLDGNGQQVCDTLSQGAIDKIVSESLGTGDCAQIMRTVSGDLAADTRARLRNVRLLSLHISGDHATARDSTGGAPDRFVRIDGHWYFAGSSFG
jgi:hypothetical protein